MFLFGRRVPVWANPLALRIREDVREAVPDDYLSELEHPSLARFMVDDDGNVTITSLGRRMPQWTIPEPQTPIGDAPEDPPA